MANRYGDAKIEAKQCSICFLFSVFLFGSMTVTIDRLTDIQTDMQLNKVNQRLTVSFFFFLGKGTEKEGGNSARG